MAINFGSYELLLAEKIKDASEIESLILSRALEKIKSGAVDVVATTGDLPTATGNENKLYYVTQDKTIYISTANLWVPIDTTISNELYSQGRNTYGELGTGNITCYSSPVQEVSSSTNWSKVEDSSGPQAYHALAIKTDGTLWSWGYNFRGQLGTGDVISYSSPVQEISSSTNWATVSSGTENSAGIKSDGTLWGWGVNSNGQLGINNTIWASSPVQEVSSSTNWSIVSSGYYTTAAIKTDGTLWVWGRNTNGILGTDNITTYSSPVQEASSSTNWTDVNISQYTCFAIKSDGTLWCWGEPTSGKLPTDNNTICYSSPVQEVSSSTNWSSVDSGRENGYAIKTDGTLWAWGYRTGIGNNTSGINYSSPVQEASSSTNWSKVSGGYYHVFALKTDGTLWGWGDGYYGNIGSERFTNYSSPAQEISSRITWSSLANRQGPYSAISAITVSPRQY